MKKRITLLIVCVLLAVTACGNSTERQIAKQLELGTKYLSELNYEEAIVAFQKVIDLEPKNVEAYLQLGEIYLELKDCESAMAILEKGYKNTNDSIILEKLESVTEMSANESETVEEKPYEQIYSKDIYSAYLENLEICMSGNTFENSSQIKDLSLFFTFFSMNEYTYEEQEQWYDSVEETYKVPGEIVRNTLQKYMDFENLTLEDHFNSYQENDINYYDSAEDFYYTKYFGGFGGEHEGYETVKCTVVEPGIVEAIGSYERYNGETYVIKVLVKEEPNDVLKLISFHEERIWSENTIADATKGPLTLSGTLTKETGTHPNGDEFTGYMLILDNPIPHLQVEDWDGYVSVMDHVEKIEITMDDRNILESSLGKHVTVEGIASYALTAWYLRGLYLDAYSLY